MHANPILSVRNSMSYFNIIHSLGDLANVLDKFPGSARQFLSIGSDIPVIATPRDPLVYEYQGALRQSTDEWASVSTPAGATTVTPAQYVDLFSRLLHPDVAVLLSDDVPSDAKRARASTAVHRTVLWAKECIQRVKIQSRIVNNDNTAQVALFAAIQGGGYPDLRKQCAESLIDSMSDLAGICIGGLGTGESPEVREEIILQSMQDVPCDKARMVLGPLGSPLDILDAVCLGIDVFDPASFLSSLTAGGHALCFPLSLSPFDDASQRLEASGCSDADGLSNSSGTAGARDDTKLNLWALTYKLDSRPLVSGCPCLTCTAHSRAYVHHLLQTHEMSAQVLLEAHNTAHYLRFFAAIRSFIKQNKLTKYHDMLLELKQRWVVGE